MAFDCSSYDTGCLTFNLHPMKCSRKKFKKMLMADGWSRDQAERLCMAMQILQIPYGEAKMNYIIVGKQWIKTILYRIECLAMNMKGEE